MPRSEPPSPRASSEQKAQPATPPDPLTSDERAELVRCERVIERGLAVFIEVGEAILKVRDGRLYREHGTFEEYLRVRWGISRSHGYRLMDGAKQAALVRAVSPTGDVPRGEAQTRELKKIDRIDLRSKVVDRVEQRGGFSVVTAEEVGRLRDEVVAEWKAQQRRAHSRSAGSEFVSLLRSHAAGEWALDDDFSFEPHLSVEPTDDAAERARRRLKWLESAARGAEQVADRLPEVIARLSDAVERERIAVGAARRPGDMGVQPAA